MDWFAVLIIVFILVIALIGYEIIFKDKPNG